ncbi:hypothetical protein TCAL_16160, partial [Tigriopus californicus]
GTTADKKYLIETWNFESSFRGRASLQNQLNAWKFNIQLDPNRHLHKLHRSKSPRFLPSQPQIEYPGQLHHFLAFPQKWPAKEVIHVHTSQETPFISHVMSHRTKETDPYPHPGHDTSTSASHLDPKLSSPWAKNDPLIPNEPSSFRQNPRTRVTRNL